MSRSAPTILVAEDEETILRFVSLVLTRSGYRVLPAACGAAALKLCDSGAEALDLALLDIVMPRMDGPQLCTRLRGVYPDLRVLYMSGFSDEEVTRRCGTATVILKKPFT